MNFRAARHPGRDGEDFLAFGAQSAVYFTADGHVARERRDPADRQFAATALGIVRTQMKRLMAEAGRATLGPARGPLRRDQMRRLAELCNAQAEAEGFCIAA